ncbi:MAG: glycosyltransferase family 2 protein [Bacteroidales bacterium]|nr:glycosyltransferase family 2 protein [Bacteroidales bacterium]
MNVLEIYFWLALLIVFYTYLGYGIIIFCLVKVKELLLKKDKSVGRDELPEVTLLIAAYNEEDIIDEKMQNCLQIRYPEDKLKIVWVTDGSNDSTNVQLSQYDRAKVFFSPERKGKSAAINRVVPLIESPIIILTDANTMINDLSVSLIVEEFQDSKVGCVAGEKRISMSDKESLSSGGEGIYWKYESFLKDMDSRLYSAVGAAGELFAIRRSLYEEMPPDILLDDFVLSMKIAARGYVIRYCKEAYAVEQGSVNINEERKRKVRISAGGIQSILVLARILNPVKYPTLFFQYISHRVLRWSITPVALFSLLPVNAAIVIINPHIIYISMLALQLLFYSLAILGKKTEGKETSVKILFVPYYFLFMNYNVFPGIVYLIRKKRGDGTWEKSRRR